MPRMSGPRAHATQSPTRGIADSTLASPGTAGTSRPRCRWLLLAGMQRTGSSVLQRTITSSRRDGAFIDIGEFFTPDLQAGRRTSMFNCSRRSDNRARTRADQEFRLRRPRVALSAAHAQCCAHTAPAPCVIVSKVFNPPTNAFDERTIADLLVDPRSCVVILERRVADTFCSFWWAIRRNNWASFVSHPKCPPSGAGGRFAYYASRHAAEHRQWYSLLRRTLAGKPHAHLMFENYTQSPQWAYRLVEQLVFWPPSVASFKNSLSY